MLYRVISTLIKRIRYPNRVKSSITTNPSFLHFLKLLVLSGENICYCAHRSIFRKVKVGKNSFFIFCSVNSSYTDNVRTSVNSSLCLFCTSNVNNSLKVESLSSLEEEGQLVRRHNAHGKSNSSRSSSGSLRNLQLIHNQIRGNNRQRPRHLPLCFLLLQHKLLDIAVGTSSHALIRHDSYSCCAKLTKGGTHNLRTKYLIDVP
mmetsp:Transcript_4901/g.6733  ORF Transcript_4901/g.6733 Transcript_4901/m.6733 type:complete len:204 (+) Transcript_4901:425-1036(+)